MQIPGLSQPSSESILGGLTRESAFYTTPQQIILQVVHIIFIHYFLTFQLQLTCNISFMSTAQW